MGCLKKLENTLSGLPAGLGVVAIEPVQPGAGMGVDDAQGRVLAAQILAKRNQNGVFEDVGMVAGVKGVAVREHRAIFASKPLVRASCLDASP